MSLLINDELIWISVPRCASHSIENSFYNSNLKIEHHNNSFKYLVPGDIGFKHEHVNLYNLNNRWLNKKTIRIKRDWMERWLSALEHLWFSIKKANNRKPIIPYEEIDNDFIYRTFTKKFGNTLYSEGGQYNIFYHLIKDFELTESFKLGTRTGLLWSQNYWLSGEKQCDYEFDINELDKFADFIEKRYGEKLIIEHQNKSKKKTNKIIVNDDLKNHIWEIFESPFNKSSKIF
jgi:hypothetical protein